MRLRLTLAFLMVLATVSSQVLADYQFIGGFWTEGATSGVTGGKCTVTGATGASDDSSGGDIQLGQYSYDKPLYVAFYKSYGVEGWNAANGFYVCDSRAALLAGQVKTEDIYVWAAPGTSAESILLNAGGGGYDNSYVVYALKLVSTPSGITYTGPTQWTTAANITLPFYSTANGLAGYHFQAQFAPVPEPSSILALVGGLAGLGGFALRRRRR